MSGVNYGIGVDGWPLTFDESQEGSALIEAINHLHPSEPLVPERTRAEALTIWRGAQNAKEQAMKRNLPATKKQSDDELQKFYVLSERLKRHIQEMHEPAIAALADELCFVFELENRLSGAMQAAHHAYSVSPGQEIKGRRFAVEASQVAEISGASYLNVTGRRPTYTTNPNSGEISGEWPSFLASVFEALGIAASVANQARRVSALMAP